MKIAKTYESKATTFESDSIDLELFKNVSLQITCEEIDALDATAILRVTNGQSWVEMSDTESILSEVESSAFFDIQTGAAFVSAKVTINSGSSNFKFNWVLKP